MDKESKVKINEARIFCIILKVLCVLTLLLLLLLFPTLRTTLQYNPESKKKKSLMN